MDFTPNVMYIIWGEFNFDTAFSYAHAEKVVLLSLVYQFKCFSPNT